MKLALSILLGLAAMALSPSQASAQQRRLVTYQTVNSSGMSVSMDAYMADSVDEPPTFQGGDMALMRYINSHRRYPQEAYRAGLEGRVLVCFVVDAEGQVSGVEVLRGVEESLNREAVRIVENMPRWNPGLVDDEPVPVYCILSIPFRI